MPYATWYRFNSSLSIFAVIYTKIDDDIREQFQFEREKRKLFFFLSMQTMWWKIVRYFRFFLWYMNQWIDILLLSSTLTFILGPEHYLLF